ncbi:hypothetical protein BDV98DRAFT_595193 [Pterulicium gracile]|uniref:F-box domain-containing protein n=1 Tax=Pterulicium gracile TaxID=1884261 RepID=A0A5C3QBQ9_9AGAR|nr:hypothetical protein BDV98DRAFT_595193 [Pterula gracilis]
MNTLTNVLPVEIIAEILEFLDLESLITVSHVSWGLRRITTDPSLNPWRHPVLRTLRAPIYEPCLKHLVTISVPEHTWAEILSRAKPAFLLFDCTVPYLKDNFWKDAFERRFLPSWKAWRKTGTWKSAFLRVLHRMWHRSQTSCTSEEAWTKYIVLNRSGSANALDASSRNMNPSTIFEGLKHQNNLAHLPTRIRVIVELADVRILAFGTTNNPSGSFTLNPIARDFVHPPGLEPEGLIAMTASVDDLSLRRVSTANSTLSASRYSVHSTFRDYHHMIVPQSAPSHEDYPFLTLGGGDMRWVNPDDYGDLKWVGGLMIMAQIVGPRTHERVPESVFDPTFDSGLVMGPGRSQYASFTWEDLWAVAPWLEARLTKQIDGPGLGLD